MSEHLLQDQDRGLTNWFAGKPDARLHAREAAAAIKTDPMSGTARPILFSAPMVRAILAGTKMQTRRVVKPQPTHFVGGPGVTDAAGNPWPREPAVDEQSCSVVIRCPYGQPGDLLWVREAWRAPASCDHLPPRSISDSEAVSFMADETVGLDPGFGKGRPGMFMPRWASRITLRITSVRMERLQDISRGDAVAEGCPFANMAAGPDPRDWYRDLWNEINGAGAWDENPWVWVVSFKRVRPGR